jgi:hypothetical protein
MGPVFFPVKNIQGNNMIKLAFADGVIEKITCSHEDLFVDFLDWQEKLWVITFKNVSGFKGIGAVGSEVSEFTEEEDGAFLQEIVSLDPLEGGRNYCFTSARGGNIILIVVAKCYEVEVVGVKG